VVRLIRALSGRAEFVIVLLVAFAPFVLKSTVSVFDPPAAPMISNRHLISLLVYEPLVLTAIVIFIRLRSWTLGRLGLASLLPLDTVKGVGLLVITSAINWLVWWLLWNVAPDLVTAAGHRAATVIAHDFQMAIIIAASAVNGLFEELLLCGYVMSVVKSRHGEWTAINFSATLRLSYHLYQGLPGAIGIIPVGLIFGLAFARTGRLWPLVIAHALLDMLALIPYVAA